MATVRSRPEALSRSPVEPLTLACALEVEERVARKAGARAARVGLGAALPLPEGRLVSFGFAGALDRRLRPGALVTATKVVDAGGKTLWEGEPIAVEGAEPVVICASRLVVDGPTERDELATATGAHAVDMESGALAASGRLAGVVRAISDSGEQPLGRFALAANVDGSTRWSVVVRAFLFHPVASLRTALAARRAIGRLARAAEALR
jgi:adenosylhomocysteine nucleosidase